MHAIPRAALFSDVSVVVYRRNTVGRAPYKYKWDAPCSCALPNIQEDFSVFLLWNKMTSAGWNEHTHRFLTCIYHTSHYNLCRMYAWQQEYSLHSLFTPAFLTLLHKHSQNLPGTILQWYKHRHQSSLSLCKFTIIYHKNILYKTGIMIYVIIYIYFFFCKGLTQSSN